MPCSSFPEDQRSNSPLDDLIIIKDAITDKASVNAKEDKHKDFSY